MDNCRLLANVDFQKCENKIKQKEILTKIECAGTKFSHRNDLGMLDPAQS